MLAWLLCDFWDLELWSSCFPVNWALVSQCWIVPVLLSTDRRRGSDETRVFHFRVGELFAADLLLKELYYYRFPPMPPKTKKKEDQPSIQRCQ